MVTQVTSFSRNGLSDFIVQRATAYILASYTVVLVGWLLVHGDLSYADWQGLFSQTWMQVFTLLALLSTCAHAWIGMWTIGTDYIREHYFGPGADGMRLIYQVVCILTLACYLIWGIKILWGN
ncbi:MAG: succinate dehydrogenase, hydrophobic membrane anchor protein [Pseudomonadales bacterium]|jgi:succinate dehydrogenase / fumarate reductase, membrane anchor subunit|nr:succinate dehydrogenase, hydrophobic membrane anchor protein [Pseudomonadales bacterium]